MNTDIAEFRIKVDATNECISLLNGELRLKAQLSAGLDVHAVDYTTGRRYGLFLQDGKIVAKELQTH